MFMLCRNRVADFAKWKAIFDSHKSAHEAVGLHLLKLWRMVDDRNNIFFLFEVEDIDRANEFINDPLSAETGNIAGVIDGEYHFIEEDIAY